MKFYLVVAKGSREGMAIPISVDLFLIGSDAMCQLRKPSLGARHCALVTRDRKVFVRDMDSGLPTLVNGAVIPPGEEWPLHKEDRISLGTLEFVIDVREHILAQSDLEEWALRSLDVQEDREADPDYDSDHRTAAFAAQSILSKLNAMTGLVTGQFRISDERGITVVRFNSLKLVETSEVASAKKELCDNLNRANLRVLLDLKNVRRLSSQAVMMLADLSRWLRPWGSTMAVCRMRPELKSALSMLQVESIPIFRDKKIALQSNW